MKIRYKVLSPIEHDGVLYVPADPGLDPTEGAKFVPGRSSVPVDRLGEIELTEDQAAPMIYGQLPKYQGKPESIAAAELRAKKAKEDADAAAVAATAAAAKAAAEKAEYQEFLAFKRMKAASKEG